MSVPVIASHPLTISNRHGGVDDQHRCRHAGHAGLLLHIVGYGGLLQHIDITQVHLHCIIDTDTL